MAHPLFKKWKEHCVESQQAWDKLSSWPLVKLVSGPITPNLLSRTVLAEGVPWPSVLVYVPSPCSSSLGRADQNPEYSRVCWEPWFFPWSRSLCPWGWTLLPISFLSSWTSSSLTWTMHGHKDAATPPEAGTRKPLQRKGPAGCCFMSLKKRRRWGTAEKEIAPLHIQTSYKISGSYQL